MRRHLAAVGLACAVWSGALAAPIPPANLTPDQLAVRLGADSFADREAATKALEALGSAALPALRKAVTSDDPETRRRAIALLEKIERTAESTKRVAAKTVALAYRNVPLGTAVNDLKARTGIPLVLDPVKVADPLRKVTCETGELPVWQAVEAFCQAAGLREVFTAELDIPKPETRPRRGYIPPTPLPPAPDAVPIVLADGKGDPLPGDRSTAVRVLVLPPSFPLNRVTLGSSDITLSFDVTPVPGLNWHDVAGVRVNRVIDSTGRAGGAGTPAAPDPGFDPFLGGMGFAPVGRAMRWDFDGNPYPPGWHLNPRVVPVPVRLGSPAARSLKRLEGAVFGEVTVPDQQLVVFDDPAKQVGTRLEGPGGLRATLLELRDGGTVRVQLEFPSPILVNARRRGMPFAVMMIEPLRPNQHGNQVQGLDADGKPVPPSGDRTADINDDGATMTQVLHLTFRKGLPAKLTVVGPRQVPVEIPFALENVRLP